MKKLLLLVLLTATIAAMVYAVPARPGYRLFYQPDGSSIVLELRGDEHFHFARTEDGFSVITDAEGWWTYAQKVDGLLYPTSFIVGKDSCPFEAGLAPDVDAVMALPQNELKPINWKKFVDINIESKAGLSDSAVLVVLGAFDDSTFLGTQRPANVSNQSFTLKTGFTSAYYAGGTAHDSLYWDSVFFSFDIANLGTKGSFKEYFYEISFGQWECYGNVIGPVSAGDPYLNYGDGAELSYMQDAAYRSSGRMELFGDAYSNYDGDGNGEIDHWVCVRAGGEQSGTGSTDDMWATKYTTTISTTTGATIRNPTNAGELTDALMNTYSFEQLTDTLFVRSRTLGIGVHCHESFHAFGAPDLYDYGYQGEPAGDWSLMDGGSWSDDGVQPGSRPPHPGAMLQYSFIGEPETVPQTGFLDESWRTVINTNGRYPVVGLSLPPSYGGPRMYMVQNSNFQTAVEYFIVENRCDFGIFESCLPENGLLISHYDQSEKGSYYNEGPDYYTYWVEQIGFDPVVHQEHPAETIYRNGAASAPFFAGNDEEFTNLTSAGANVNGSTVTFGPYILSVSAPGDTMYFTVGNANVPATGSFAKRDMEIFDTITNYGNDNGLANPDEMFDFVIQLQNVGGAANTVTAVLTNTDGDATVIDANGAWGNMASNATAWNSADPFRVKINPGLPDNELVEFNLVISSSNGSTVLQIAFSVNSAQIVGSFNLTQVSLDLADPAGLDIIWNDAFGTWIMVANGTGLGNVLGQTGASRVYWFDIDDDFNTGNVVVDFMTPTSPEGGYVMGIDHDAVGNIWWALSNYCYSYDFSTGTPVLNGYLNWGNTDYGAADPVRVRCPTFNNDDSLFGYWHEYATLTESLFGYTKNLGGSASTWEAIPLTDGTAYGGTWNNGRGLEWDGTAFWSLNIFDGWLYRRDATDFTYFYKTPIPSVFGSYPAYDIAWQACASDGSGNITPYGEGNRFYMWTVNMDNADVYKVDVTDAVLPKAVDLDIASCTVNNVTKQATLVWNANPSTDFVDHYIVYRSTDPNFYASASTQIGTTGSTTYTDSPPISKDVTYYYKVKAVNWHGYSLNSSFEALQADFTTAKHELSLNASQINADVVLTWMPSEFEGTEWKVLRKSDNSEYELIGKVACAKNDFAGTYNFTDTSVPTNGTYYYTIELVEANGSVKKFNEIRFKYFNTLVFGITPLDINPVRGDLVLKYGIDRSGDVSLKLYNITGSVVANLASGAMNPGTYSVKVNDIPSGTYFAVLQQGDRVSKERIVLLK